MHYSHIRQTRKPNLDLDTTQSDIIYTLSAYSKKSVWGTSQISDINSITITQKWHFLQMEASYLR